jgi:hypothetical protein
MTDRGDIIVLATRVDDLRKVGLLDRLGRRPDALALRCRVCGADLLCFPDTLAAASRTARPYVACIQCAAVAYGRVPDTDPAAIERALRFVAEYEARLEAWEDVPR